MIRFLCPHCQTKIEHQAELAGTLMMCVSCRGLFYEPTDPLPGKEAEPAAPSLSSPVSALEPSSGEAKAAAVDASDRTFLQATDLQATETPALSKQLAACTPGDMMQEMSRRGYRALLMAWAADNEQHCQVVYTGNMTLDDLVRMMGSELTEGLQPHLEGAAVLQNIERLLRQGEAS